jgi:hypothetical protein
MDGSGQIVCYNPPAAFRGGASSTLGEIREESSRRFPGLARMRNRKSSASSARILARPRFLSLRFVAAVRSLTIRELNRDRLARSQTRAPIFSPLGENRKSSGFWDLAGDVTNKSPLPQDSRPSGE